MTGRQTWLARLSFAVWLAALGLGVHYGRRLAPWLEGANSAYTLTGLMVAGVAGLVWAAKGLGPRPLAWARLCLAALGLALLGWSQPLMIERLHVLLYGITGLLAWNLFPARQGWARAWPAALVAATVGGLDELAQALHPQRVGDWRDVATNAAAACLTVCILAMREAKRPSPAGPDPASRPSAP